MTFHEEIVTPNKTVIKTLPAAGNPPLAGDGRIHLVFDDVSPLGHRRSTAFINLSEENLVQLRDNITYLLKEIYNHE